jgi:hypothetical protein
MATITSATASNWSNTATWVGGVVPVSGDTVILLHRIAMDVDIDNIIISNSTTAGMDITTTRSLTNLAYNGAGFASSGGLFRVSGTSLLDTVTISGSFNVTLSNGQVILINISPFNLVFNGSMIHTAFAESYSFDFRATCNATLIGIFNKFGTNGNIYFFRTGGGTIDINGTVNQVGGNGVGRGSHTSTTLRGIHTSTTTSMYQDLSLLDVSGIYSVNNAFPFVFTTTGIMRQILGESLRISFFDTSNAATNLYTADLLTGYPVESKVKDGTVYGPVGEFTGTLLPVNINTAQLATDLLTEMNTSNLTIAQGLRDGMGASAAAIAAVGSINVIP